VLDVAERLGVEVEVRTWDDVPRLVGGTGLVVSTVPGPAAEMAARSLAGAGIGGARPALGLLLDVAYDPWPTPLAQVWTALGGRVLGGLALLVHQAVDQVQLMTGVRPDVAVLAEAGRTELAARSGERARPGP
jgi:shikimate dehydrogenase